MPQDRPPVSDATLPEQHLVLVVDDDDAGRFVKCQILRRAGFHVIEASTGSVALALTREQNPDLLVLDVNLPDIPGYEVSRIVKAQVVQPATQILQVSNTAVSNADQVRGLAAGADVYLTEPIAPEVLVATVRALLRIRTVETELAATLERERAARQEAEQANRLKDEFLAALSHELRTPLNAIMGWIWQLRHTEMSDVGRDRALASLERNAKLQTQLISDLLDISRIGKGKLEITPRIARVAPIVESAFDSLRQTAVDRGIELHLHTEDADVCGDSVRLQQVVTNLLTNAIQFTPRGGTVDVRLQVDGQGEATLRVQDTGCGIDGAFLPHVFDKFRQAEGGITRRHGGLGVGLSLVKQIVDLHGGSVQVFSEGAGKGTTATIVLPCAIGAEHAMQQRCPNAPMLSGLRLMMLGGDRESRSLLAGMLEGAGAVVSSTDSGGDDLLAASAGPEPAIVIAISPLAREEHETLRRILAARDPRQTTVVLVEEPIALAAGDNAPRADATFTRPFRPSVFVRAVAEQLAR
jgi:signal transduction histidine kinase